MKLRRYDLNLVPILHALLRHRNVTKAAADVGLSQSATSHALMRLRGLFDDPLLVQSGREMILSRKAEEIQELLHLPVSALEQLFEQDHFDPPVSRRHFRIATSDYVSTLFLPILLRRLQEEAPGVTMEVLWDVQDATANLRAGQLDMIILPMGSIEADGVTSKSIYEDQLMVVSAHPKGGRSVRPFTREEFGSAKLVIFRRDTSLIRGFAEQQLVANNISLDGALFVPDFLMIPIIVAETDRIGLLHNRFAAKMRQYLPLALTPPPFPVANFRLVGYWPTANERDRGHQWFRELVLECILQGAAPPLAFHHLGQGLAEVEAGAKPD